MFPRLLPIAIVSVACAFAVATLSVGLVPDEPRLWPAAVALVILSGITPLIYAVNVRIVPVFSRRTWQSVRLIGGALIAALASGWLVFAGRALRYDALETIGHVVAFGGGLAFVISIVRLFRSPVISAAAPPLPYPVQAEIDRIGVRFTRFAGYYLLVGLGIGVILEFTTPDRGRWDLVWAHALLVGWLMHMASGVCYHVLSRWTGKPWRTPRLIGLHFHATAVATPLMLLALALDVRWMLALGGLTQAIALLLFAINVAPMTWSLPPITRWGLLGAVAFLITGVVLGGLFAIDPVAGARLRISHAVVNLLGWTGLLISSVSYYLFPRFAGQTLRWPRLAIGQLVAQALGVILIAVGFGLRSWDSTYTAELALAGATLAGFAMVTYGGIIGMTFRRKPQRAAGTVGNIVMVRPAGKR
jgi:hypothetical protein